MLQLTLEAGCVVRLTSWCGVIRSGTAETEKDDQSKVRLTLLWPLGDAIEPSISQCCVPFPAGGETAIGFPEAGTVQPPAITFQAGVAPLVPPAVSVALARSKTLAVGLDGEGSRGQRAGDTQSEGKEHDGAVNRLLHGFMIGTGVSNPDRCVGGRYCLK